MGKKANNIIFTAACLLLFVICITLGIAYANYKTQPKTVESVQEETVTTTSAEDILAQWDSLELTYDGATYKLNDDIRTILFLGIDQTGEIEEQKYEGTGGRSDCIILLAVNDATKEIQRINISRDTMTDIDIYTVDGTYFATEIYQLTMQYSFGESATRSCWLTEKAVSNLLYGMDIDYYLSVNLDGLATLTDSLGGVTIEIPADYTYIEDAFVEGSTITLDGALAERYVRFRDTTEYGSNNDRMDRQNDFIMAALTEFQGVSSTDLLSLWEEMQLYIETDASIDILKVLQEYTVLDDALYLPGEDAVGVNHDEYYINYEQLKAFVIEQFYVLVEE
ncbi:MAG: LCP family protein [Lachnospiraceae bacterium]